MNRIFASLILVMIMVAAPAGAATTYQLLGVDSVGDDSSLYDINTTTAVASNARPDEHNLLDRHRRGTWQRTSVRIDDICLGTFRQQLA